MRCGRPIPSHSPCTLIQAGERLNVKFVKPAGGQKLPLAKLRAQTRLLNQLVVFNILTKGGKNITKVTRNPALRLYTELTVYAYKGEKVKRALKRDGRFLNTIFDKTCALSETSTDVNTEMSNIVDDLDGKTFQIIMLNKASPPDSQSSSLEVDEYFNTLGDSQSPELDESHNAFQQVAPKEGGNPNELEYMTLCKIPGSKKMCSHLSSLMRDFIQRKMRAQDKTGELLDVHDLLRVEYGKSSLASFEVKTMKMLMNLSKSVCQVRVNNRPVGSGFLLFDTFALTNGHVINEIFNDNRWELSERVTVHFSFESLDQTDGGQEVLEVVAFEYGTDVSGHNRDWALLSLGADQMSPDGLLTHFGFLPQSGSIHLIGHPGGGVKKVDPSWIIPVGDRSQLIQNRFNENIKYSETEQVQFITQTFFEGVARAVYNSRDLTYDTCFYFGSSGSPVFDSHCNLVAMHSGGFIPTSATGETQSVVEYGHPLSVILENLIIQLVQRGRLDVLKKYLDCTYKHDQAIMDNVKKLVDSRNYTEFKNTANNLNVLQDDALKMFFELFCQTEAPVSMDIG